MSRAASIPFVSSVVHPTDFSAASDHAFAHALAISLARQTRFCILHAGPPIDGDWSEFPAVRETLTRWRLLAPGSDRSAVFEELAVRVLKLNVPGDPVDATLEQVEARNADLVVVATEGREGVARFLRPSVAHAIGSGARTRGAMTLFVPAESRGFVRREDGHLSLRRVLVPVDHRPDSAEALVRATRGAQLFGDGDVEVTVLHVGDEFPPVAPPQGDAWRCSEVMRGGDVVREILAAGADSDLIVMATDGRDGVLDALRGSFTERIVREASCPVLAVPAV